MATPEEEKSKSSERSEQRKRQREESSTDDKTRRRKKSRSEANSTAATKKKVRTISELVKKVISGEVSVPRSLSHYAEDRVQLLDQVFTILSESDVRGMLPDILKGLKMRQVRQLCLEQLKAMSTEDIVECVEPPKPPDTLNVDAAVLELLGTETAVGAADGNGSSSAEKKIALTDNVNSNTGNTEREEEEEGEMRERVSEECSGDEGKVMGTGVETWEKSVCVEEDETAAEQGSPTQTMECDTTTSDFSRDEEKGKQQLEGESKVGSEGESESACSGGNSSDSDLEDCWLSDFPQEVSQWARLQEIEFRRRALEAELRRRGEIGEPGETRESVVERGLEGEKVDKSQAIELQLRQRALQSLLAKKKEHQNQH